MSEITFEEGVRVGWSRFEWVKKDGKKVGQIGYNWATGRYQYYDITSSFVLNPKFEGKNLKILKERISGFLK